MICNICGKKEATVHLTEITNGQMIEVHICDSCAAEKGTEFKTYFNFSDLLSNVPGLGDLIASTGKKESLLCKSCGMPYEEFSKDGRLGCPGCYDAFRKPLGAVIKQVQRAGFHVGKKPSKIAKNVRNVHDLRRLQERLRKSVETEAFEEAALLRDEIKQMEDKLKKGKKGK
ncbi:MAG: UvrB/UvrC motif-containing protein [Candidatus Omnitrophica bacterium]|nr:UvrB/UvrC motif-containing protein [Candidatus Omnitrophota bacterium]